MRSAALVLGLFFVVILSAHADTQIASAQQALKDQGFYYGEITGTKDADTTAAIRRYQIRNGLQITGELNAETQKSLGLKGGAPAAPATPAPRAPAPAPPPRRTTPPPDTSDLRDDPDSGEGSDADDEDYIEPEQRAAPFPSEPVPRPGYAPGPRGLYPDTTRVFADTPNEIAPPDLQRQVLVGAQMRLARQGYYRSAIDGVYGPGMAAALRAFQSRAGLEPTGALDMETLEALGLLPAPHRRGYGPPRRMLPPRTILAPNGEPVYTPR